MANAPQITPGYQLIVETMSEGAVTLKADGAILYANRRFADLVGHELERVTGSSLRTFVAPGALDDFDRIIRQACAGSARGRIDLLRPDSSLVPAGMAMHRLDGDGTPGIVAVITDLSELQRVQTMAEEEAAKFRGLVELGIAGVVIIREDGRIAYLNPAFRSLVGYDAGEVVGKPFLDFIAEPDRAASAEVFAALIAGRQRSILLAFGIRRKDGTILDAVANGGLTRYEGRPGTISVILDISERKRAEEAVRKSSAEAEDLYNNAPCGYQSVDENGVIIRVNDTELALLGYRRDELVGKMRGVDLCTPASRDIYEQAFLVLKAQGPTQGPTMKGHELELIRKDGTVLPVMVSATAVRDEAGKFLRSRTTLYDMTERKRAEIELREQEAIVHSLVEQEVIGAYIVAADGTCSYINPYFAKMLGYAPAEIIGRRILDFATDSSKELLQRQVLAKFSGELPASGFDTSFVRKDGSNITVLAHSALASFRGKPALIGVALDITERKRAEEAVRKSAAEAEDLYNNAPCGYQSVDENGVIIQVNDTELALLGYRRDEFVGKMRTVDLCTPASRDIYEQAFLVLKAQGSTTRNVELEMIRKDGTVLPVMMNATAMRDEAGKFLRSRTTLYDMTERRRAEAEHLEQEAIFQGLVEQGVIGAYIIAAADGTCAYINPYMAKMLGYAPAEIIGRRILDFATDSSKELLQRQLLAEFSAELRASGFDTSFVRKDGSNITVLAHSALASFRGKPALIGVALDITERKQVETTLRCLNRALKTLSGGNEVLVRATDEAQLLHEMCRVIVERGGYLMAWIGIPRDDAAKTVTPVAHAGADGEYLQSARITWGDDAHGNGATGRAIKTGKTQVNTSFATDESMAPWRSAALEFGFVSSVALPLKDESGVSAVLTIDAAEADAFGSEELALLEELTRDLAYGIKALRDRTDREAAERRWQEGLEAIVSAIASTVEIRDIYTSGHQQRVAELAVAMAREMRLPEDQIHGLHLAGIIHDVGKISVPFEILNKPSKLSKAEFEIVQGHVQSGYDIIKGIKFPWPIAQILLQHHERLDGSGYPNGAKGDEMLIESKILGIADVVDAMMSHRPYRPALGSEAALAEIQQGRGKIYDAAAVDACVHVMAQKTRPPA